MSWDTFLAWLTTVLGIFGAVLAATRLARQDTHDFVEVQHTVWVETRSQLEDCRAEVTRLRGP